MIISIIAAMDENRGIGIQNKLPWHLPGDLKRFKELTLGHHIILGRKTFESIGKPLPGRTSIIVTHQKEYTLPGCLITHSLEEALEMARCAGQSEVFIAGGAQIYAQALPIAHKIYLTVVHSIVQADTFFPHIDGSWKEVESSFYRADEKNKYSFTYKIFIKG